MFGAPYNPAPVLMCGLPRSSQWSKVRKNFLAKNPRCVACGANALLNVHHIRPYHLFPDLELVESNLITLCETPTRNCHFVFGHCFNWKLYNIEVKDVTTFFRECVSDANAKVSVSDKFENLE